MFCGWIRTSSRWGEGGGVKGGIGSICTVGLSVSMAVAISDGNMLSVGKDKQQVGRGSRRGVQGGIGSNGIGPSDDVILSMPLHHDVAVGGEIRTSSRCVGVSWA